MMTAAAMCLSENIVAHIMAESLINFFLLSYELSIIDIILQIYPPVIINVIWT